MTMDKYGVADNDRIAGLRNEESNIMQRISYLMSNHLKTASEEQELSQLQEKLAVVRQEITDHDLKKPS